LSYLVFISLDICSVFSETSRMGGTGYTGFLFPPWNSKIYNTSTPNPDGRTMSVWKWKPYGEFEKTDAGLHGYNGLKIRLTSENPRLKISLTC